MGLCSIEVAPNGKFLIKTNEDVSFFGWTTVDKFESYYMEMTWANLIDLKENKDKYGLKLHINDDAKRVMEYIKQDYDRIKAAQIYKTMNIDELESTWQDEGFERFLVKARKHPKFKNVQTHQKRAILFFLELMRAGIYAEQGLGKTLMTILILSKLYDEDKIKKPLVFAPVTLLNDEGWFEDLAKFSDFKPVNLRDEDALISDGDISFINPDKISSWCFVKTKDAEHHYDKNNFFETVKFDAIMFDEASALKSNSSYTTKGFLNFQHHSKYLALLTGTPAPNKIFQFWPQMKALGSILGDNYEPFENRYGVLRTVGPKKQIYFPRPNAEAQIKKRIELVSYFLPKEGNVELPEISYHTKYVYLNEQHLKIYKEIEEEYVSVVSGKNLSGETVEGKAVAKHELTVRMKLLQILNGFTSIKDEEDEEHLIELDWNPKLDMLHELLTEELTDPSNYVIIWCRFRKEVEKILEKYQSLYNGTYIYGGMTEKNRLSNLSLWKNDPTCRFIVGNPKSAKFGHNWQKANRTIYLSSTEDYEDYSQSATRNYRFGQEREIKEYHIIVKNSLEPLVWRALHQRQRLDKFLKNVILQKKGV